MIVNDKRIFQPPLVAKSVFRNKFKIIASALSLAGVNRLALDRVE